MFNIQEQLKLLPNKPGVYIMKNKEDDVIYVGKAISLKNRVRQYFQSAKNHPPKVQAMVSHISFFEYIVTDTELEALILECNLIKKNRPKYNVLLRDDKTYPYIKVSVSEEYPRVLKTRNIQKDKNRYFGPYTNISALNETLDIIHRMYPIRTCKKNITRMIEKKERPCLNYHIKKCIGPCKGNIYKEDYTQMIDEILLILGGKQEELIKRLKKKMNEASMELNYEKAALFRDQLRSLDSTLEKQKIVTDQSFDQDVIGLASNEEVTCVQVFFIREGKLIHREHYDLNANQEESKGEILSAFIKQFYSNVSFIPKEILVEEDILDKDIIEEWLKKKKGKKVSIKVPHRGDKKNLLEMVKKNAVISLIQLTKSIPQNKKISIISELQNLLRLDAPPARIEAYDISNTQGVQSVGSMVVFHEGKAKHKDYRRFKIKTIEGPNDYGSLEEIIKRRFQRGIDETNEIIEGKLQINDGKFMVFPDLIMVDGGFGQVSSVEKVLNNLDVKIPVCGMIKDNRHRTRGIAFMGEEIILNKHTDLFRFIYRIQEEVHRFAIAYHKTLRKKDMLKSELEEIKGIGEAKRKALMKHFKSIDSIKGANIDQLQEVKGITKGNAEEIIDFFKK
ncbi:excinuclease ABC subunit UvrC [Alkaliphilus peptidifermentans]|uniref:UvrABC system protein C n=1 Tax=Alkaliphilus peptidifermentans DSM 18978 TaxID=1120976 RepID=A0A1G5GAE1_9FIRM|nr:excinuclease ABC subunit UvrC [Alkaliphilus peptidifermentans]SCY48210.1 Excinuclease ABC subunit C [Alkaliphilus peptidifermentans DSM 18978]